VPLGGALGTPSSGTLTNATGLPLANGVTGILPVANGGTGTPTPSLVAGANVTITGSWPNQTIAAAGGGGGGGGHGTVTSVGLSVPTGFAVANSPITDSGTLALSFAAGYSLPLTATQAGWDAAAVLAGTAVQPAGLASGLASKAETGLIGSSGLTMNANRLVGRSTAGTGAPEEISTSGGLVLVGGVLVPGEIVKLVVSDVGETGITTGNFKSETRIDRAFAVVGVWWSCHPTAMGSASTSDARPYIRTGAGTTSAGTKTNLLTSASNIASLAASVHTVDATSSISGGTYSGSAGDWLGVDLMSLGTGSSGHQLTLILRYS
jgi:hypothetical protein